MKIANGACLFMLGEMINFPVEYEFDIKGTNCSRVLGIWQSFPLQNLMSWRTTLRLEI